MVYFLCEVAWMEWKEIVSDITEIIASFIILKRCGSIIKASRNMSVQKHVPAFLVSTVSKGLVSNFNI